MIIERFEQQIKKNPQKIAIKAGNKMISFLELHSFSNRISNNLNMINKIKPCEKNHVALLLDDAIEMIASILGVLKSGYQYIPLTSEYPINRIEYIIHHAEIDVFITDIKNREYALKASGNKKIDFIFIEEIRDEMNSNVLNFERHISPDKNAYILYTSGSTGFPKGVSQTHRNVVSFIDRYIETLDLTEKDNLTMFSSFIHDASIVDIFTALFTGAVLYPMNLTKGDMFSKLPGWLEKEKISVWHSVPTVYRYFTAELETKLDITDLRFIVLGGEAVLKNDIEKFYTFFPPHCALYNLYGQTESTYNSGQFFKAANHNSGDDFSITLGNPVPGTQIFIIDENGNEAPLMVVGEIIVVSSFISPGYWKDEKSNKDKFSVDSENGRIYFTGDLGRRLPSGMIEYIGRMDNQVKIRGYRIELGEIENIVIQYQDITQAAVLAIENAANEKYIACYFSSRNPIDINGLKKFLSEYLMDYMIPAYFRKLEKFPLTVSGKIDRRALPKPEFNYGESYTGPGNEIEKKLVEIWSEILGRDELEVCRLKNIIGINDNFIELGGHSLKSMILMARIHKELSTKLKLENIFKNPTIKGLAKYIIETGENSFEPIEPTEKKEYYRLSAAQKRLFVIQKIYPQSLGYNMPFALIAECDIDRDRLSTTFYRLIKRHESLRTSYIILEDEPVQKIHDEIDFKIEYFDNSVQTVHSIDSTIKNFIRPFDLSTPPMIRVGIIKIKEKEYLLVIDMHHIVTDGVSNEILKKDFILLYAKEDLPPLKLQYKDFSEWQNSESRYGLFRRQKDYWNKKFHGEIPVLNFPTDYAAPEILNFEGSSLTFLIPAQISLRIYALLKQQQTTLFTLFLAILNILLTQYTEQEDIIVGSPISGRNHIDLQNIIGMFVNMLALRNKTDNTKTFIEFLKNVQQNVFEDFDNQDYQFDELIRDLKIDRKSSENPLFNIVLAVQNIDSSKSEEIYTKHNNYFKFSYYGIKTNISRFNLVFFVRESNGSIGILCRYLTDLFKEDTIKRIGQHFIEIIDQVTINIHIKLKEILLSSDLLHGSHTNKKDDVDFDF